MTIAYRASCLTCGQLVQPDHGGIPTCPRSHFQAVGRPAETGEQALMDEYRRCSVRLHELLRIAPDATRADRLIGPCSRSDLERNGRFRSDMKREVRRLARHRHKGYAVDVDYEAKLHNMLEVSDAFDAYGRSAFAVTNLMHGRMLNTKELD
jgi:hypothetical protein